jgi:ABC-type proline/glycine betaine transport system substrate-binding protein
MRRFAICLILLFALCATCAAAPVIVLRNNYDMPYSGLVTFKTNVSSGFYKGENAIASVRSGVGYAVVRLAPHKAVRLVKGYHPAPGPLSIIPSRVAMALQWQTADLAQLSFGLVRISGRTGTAEDVVSSFQPLDLFLVPSDDGYRDLVRTGDFEIAVTANGAQAGWLDVDVVVTNKTGNKDPAYLALVRRLQISNPSDFKMRWNGRFLDGDVEPTDYQGSWGNNHCVDWLSWRSGDLSFCAVSGFTFRPANRFE